MSDMAGKAARVGGRVQREAAEIQSAIRFLVSKVLPSYFPCFYTVTSPTKCEL